ncbi:hypothetical protein [Nocardioides montaniterrae]
MQQQRSLPDRFEMRDLRDRLEDSAFLRMGSGVLYGLLGYVLVGGLMLLYYANTGGADGDSRDPVLIGLSWSIIATAVAGNAAMLRSWRRFQSDLRRWVDGLVLLDPATTPRGRTEHRITGHGKYGPSPGSGFLLGGAFIPPFGTLVPPMTVLVLTIALGDPHGAADAWQLGIALVAALGCSLLLVLVPGGQARQGRRTVAWRRASR